MFSWLLEATHTNTAGHTLSHSPFELAFIHNKKPGCTKTVPDNAAASRAVLANTSTKMVLAHMVRLRDMARQMKAWAGMANADQVRCDSTTGRHMKLAGLGVVS